MNLAHPFTLGFGAMLLIAGVVLYRRRGREDPRHGSQGAVLLLVVGVILAIHGMGLLEYRPGTAG